VDAAAGDRKSEKVEEWTAARHPLILSCTNSTPYRVSMPAPCLLCSVSIIELKQSLLILPGRRRDAVTRATSAAAVCLQHTRMALVIMPLGNTGAACR
jgi:hypothetical protein